MPVVGSTALGTAGDCFSLIRAILNDADVPTISIVSPTGAVRLSNQVTITTTTAHNLQVNNIVQVANVLDSSFNGTFQITAVPTSTTFTYAQTAADASSGTGTVSNIVQGDVFTDTVLLPFVSSGYRKVQSRLLMAGSKTSTETAELTLPIGTTEVSDTSDPQLPVDFLAPRIIQEKISGQPYYGGAMSQVDVLPSQPQQAYNYYWSWKDESLFFVGSVNAMDIRLRYYKAVTNAITDASSTIYIRGGVDAVAFWGAYLAAQSRGSSQTLAIKGQFEEAIGELKNMQAHARNYVPGRRKCYGRSRTWGWGNGNGRGTA